MPLDARPAARPDTDAVFDAGAELAERAAFEVRLAALERDIETTLDRTRGSVRYSPLRRAVWRQLLLPARYLLHVYREQLKADLAPTVLRELGEAARVAGDRGAYGRALDAMAIALVARAALGDARAIAEVFVQIEGRPGRRRPDASSDPPPMDLEPIVRLLNERR